MDDDDEVIIASFCLIFGAFFAAHEQSVYVFMSTTAYCLGQEIPQKQKYMWLFS